MLLRIYTNKMNEQQVIYVAKYDRRKSQRKPIIIRYAHDAIHTAAVLMTTLQVAVISVLNSKKTSRSDEGRSRT